MTVAGRGRAFPRDSIWGRRTVWWGVMPRVKTLKVRERRAVQRERRGQRERGKWRRWKEMCVRVGAMRLNFASRRG